MSRTGPLGALPRLSRAARRALVGCAVLAALSAVALVVQAWALAGVVTGRPVLVVLTGAVVARALLSWATQVVATRAAAGAKEELRARLLDRSLALGPEWTVSRGAELTVLATRGLDALDDYFAVYLPALVNAAILPLGIAAVLLVADWPSALVVGATLPLVPLFAALVGLHTRDRVREAAETDQRVARQLRELVRARPVLTAFRRVDAQATTIRRLSEAGRRSTMATLRVAFASALVLELVATLSVALVAVIIGMRLVGGDLSLAVGLFVLVLAPECYFPLRQAGAAHHASEAGMEAVREIAALPEPPVFGTHPAVGPLTVTDLKVRRRDAYAPDGVTFTAAPGRTIHLDTPSASGKSTTFAALLGFVAPTEGHIRVGDRELSEVDIEAWRARVAWVPQTPRFAGGTVDDELGGSHLVERLNLAHLADRPLAELSVGERQRVAVARALLRVARGADILLLDEPTAHQDPANAARVNAAIADTGAAVILASHRTTDDTAEDIAPRRTTATTTQVSQRLPLRTLVTPRLVAGAALGAAALLAGVALTATSAWLIAKAATQPPVLTLGIAVVGVRTFGLARAGLRYAERLVTHDAAFRATTEQRVRLWRTADYRRLTTDLDTVRDLTPRVLLPPLVAVGVCVAAVAVQSPILPAAGLVLAIAVAAAGLGAPAVALAVDRRATRALAAGRRRVAGAALTLLEAAPDLIANGRHRAVQADLADEDARLRVRARRQAFSAGAANALVVLALGAASVTSIALADGVDPLLLPVLALLPLALAETLAPLPAAAQHLATLRAVHTACPEVHHQDVERGMALRDVDVRWPGADAPTLRGVSLQLEPGTHLAVVGPSGAGKSTLLALMAGLLPAERGTVRLPSTAWVPQEPSLVATTLRENLRIADPHATDDQLRRALESAQIGTWADRLDDDPTTASGGEAQRIAIARALLADADLLLLDEPTAHLDEPTARRVLAGLAGRTVVHVTHRREEAARADAVLELA
ncbi:thiol reductant ABC exporter subunit CydC [Actinophytocola oryzae]|uniref:ATP-binding cassette subfamily C protein CydCD n=1 Tax=Actinophytocola oryzae TaxID=502181 RepID=A0A4R7VNL7_9PSEU|nr:thiol reductant ABC exporter subunit CydC [Actinophytocola oryzae]TDV50955.1 ATP-binding cassette subfamily C protein CydCD [Actinophytocola oryzae]